MLELCHSLTGVGAENYCEWIYQYNCNEEFVINWLNVEIMKLS